MKPFATHASEDFRLAGGGRLEQLVTAYATLGRLNEHGSNAVLVLHGYTTGPSMLFPGANAAEGSWSELIGPGRAIDTDRYFVVCPNALGSSYGSTGPRSIDPRTGRAYGGDFPSITMDDIVAAQAILLDALGIGQLQAVIGPSLGAMQAFAWAVRHPQRMQRVVAAVGAPFNPGVVRARPLLDKLEADPHWRNGRYCDVPGSMREFLVAMRIATLETYGIEAELRRRFPDAAARRAEIQRLAEGWADEFDAGSLLALARAVDTFDVRLQLPAMRAPLLYALSRSDNGFPPTLAKELRPVFDGAGLRWKYLEIDSDKGHLASGADAALWARELQGFMDIDPARSSRKEQQDA